MAFPNFLAIYFTRQIITISYRETLQLESFRWRQFSYPIINFNYWNIMAARAHVSRQRRTYTVLILPNVHAPPNLIKLVLFNNRFRHVDPYFFFLAFMLRVVLIFIQEVFWILLFSIVILVQKVVIIPIGYDFFNSIFSCFFIDFNFKLLQSIKKIKSIMLVFVKKAYNKKTFSVLGYFCILFCI